MSASDSDSRSYSPTAAPAEPGGLPPAVPEPDAVAPPSEGRRGASRRALDRRVGAIVEGMSDAFLAIGPDWRVTYANREAARLNGTTPDALVGCDHWEQWPETVGTDVEHQYRRAAAERVPVQFEHHYPSIDVWHDVRAYPADDGGLAVFYRDITGLKRLEAERARQARDLADANDKALAAETQFRLLVDRVQDYAVFLMDPDGVITHWGVGAERMKGYRPDEAIGMHLHELYPGDGRAEDGTADEHLRHAALHGEYIGEGTRLGKGNRTFLARVCLTALRRGGELVGFSKITTDLTVERERQQALAAALRGAEAASTAKSQFLANTSHEIRTPLNAIMGYAELLEIGLAGSLAEPQRQYVSRIQATSRHLLSLVNDVLDLSKIEAGQMHAASEPGLVHDVVTAAMQLVEPQAHARQVTLTNACTATSAVAYRGDVERVRQVLVNLLSNAVRFTEAGGRVTLTCGTADAPPADALVPRASRATRAPRAGGWAFVRVEDTGSGIPSEQLDRIWEAFVQADGARTRTVGGSGLGLTISRHLARLMGGDITVKSRPGMGSTFALWLPAALGEEARAHATERAIAAPPREASPAKVMAEVNDAEGAGLAALSDALLGDVERILATLVARLRTDPETPSAHRLPDAQAEDHGVTFLADVAQCLGIVGHDGEAAERMLSDGSAVQRLIAHRHGEQRRALGWAAAEVRREYAILREELLGAVARHVGRGAGPADVERASAVLAHFLADAEAESMAGFDG